MSSFQKNVLVYFQVNISAILPLSNSNTTDLFVALVIYPTVY